MLRRTPCIGICSTTYGDLVCRGCKRFAHEIVGWNAYDEDQRSVVWTRLLSLRAGATRHVLEILDASAFGAAGTAPEDPPADPHLLAYATLQHHAGRGHAAAPVLERLGLRVRDPAFAGAIEDLILRIDQEIYQRSLAQYERNYRTPAR